MLWVKSSPYVTGVLQTKGLCMGYRATKQTVFSCLAWASLLGCAVWGGCAGALTVPPGVVPGPAAAVANPTFIPLPRPEMVVDEVVDVLDNYFKIRQEVPPRVLGDQITEGRIDTFPEVGSTLLEPWRQDSANLRERTESTLQTIRRYATTRIIPSGEGFLVEVAVYKELRNMRRPRHSTAGAATFRYDNTLRRLRDPVGDQATTLGWIPEGRDTALETRIIRQLRERLGLQCVPDTGGYF